MSNPDLEGNPVEPFPLPDWCVEDPPHGWDSSHAQWNEGANDGFVVRHASDVGAEEGRKVMGYYRRDQIPVYYALADQFALCERWFASVMGPTWPNRIYAHAAQSQGQKGNDLPDNEGDAFGFTCKTVWELLEEAGYDYTDLPFLALFDFVGKYPKNLKHIEEYYADAAAGTLPRVCWIDPGFGFNDDHPPHHVGLGQMLIGSVFQALG